MGAGWHSVAHSSHDEQAAGKLNHQSMRGGETHASPTIAGLRAEGAGEYGRPGIGGQDKRPFSQETM